MSEHQVSVVIPSCDRAPILLDTIRQLLELDEPPTQIIVVDQSESLDAQSQARLDLHHQRGDIQWLRRSQRNIPAAMNHGVQVARGELILFLDDDVLIDARLVAAHREAHQREIHQQKAIAMVAGQVIQPWQSALAPDEAAYPPGLDSDPDAFRFNAGRAQPVRRFMAGNVSVRRDAMLALGGFDENFVGAAYRFEADFAQRLCDRGLAIFFEPDASVFHLKAQTGGTRSFGNHLRTIAPWHSMGRYYYLMHFPRTPGLLRRTATEAARSIVAREHLRAPWRIAGSACAEIGGLMVALGCRLRGRRLPLFDDSPRQHL